MSITAKDLENRLKEAERLLFDLGYRRCWHCGEWLHTDEAHSSSDEHMHPDCAEASYEDFADLEATVEQGYNEWRSR